jgi:two-component system, NtrC family, nitrogen regulation sensor histidine kinase NtrY
MIFNSFQFRLFLRIALLALSIFLCAYVHLHYATKYAVIILLVCVYQIYELYHNIKRSHDEVDDFVQSIHYRDFTKHFNIKQAPADLKALRNGFNEINQSFKTITREKETQYQYLQKILEIINTGILSYNTETGEMNWINETFKKMFDIPYLKTIASLEKRDEDLYQAIISIQSSASRLITVQHKNQNLRVLLTATVFKTENASNKIVACQNIENALDETEGQAWQKLLSVMTHEIMNSIGPISSLANTLKLNVQQAPENIRSNYKDLEDIELGLDTIQRRSEGLLRFAQIYRSLNKVIKPNLETVLVRDLFENLFNLMQPTLEKNEIELDIILKNPQITLSVDIHLIEQILLNLLLNAIEALKDIPNGKITLSAFTEDEKTLVKIADNGCGISPEILDNIFVPFFSTKKNGSGIGLSLSKQIMLMHKGSIHVQSVEGQGTVFVLGF